MTMDPRTAAAAYRMASIENAPPIKIVRMLYLGALRYLDNASKEDPENPESRFLYWLGRTDAIVTELRLAIDKSQGGDVVESLEKLYIYCEDEIGKAGLERSTDRIAGIRRVLEVLLDAWQHVEIDEAQVA